MEAVRDRSRSEALRVRARAAWHEILGFSRTPYALVLFGYLLLRFGGFYGIQSLRYPDTDGYLEVVGHSVFSLDFLAGGRGWTVPLLWKVLPDADHERAAGQFLLSTICWPLLAGAVARCMTGRAMRALAFGAVLLFSCSMAVLRWDTVMLSESVSISLTALLLAAWLELVRAPRRSLVAAVLGITLFWVFARDSNGVIALLTVPLLALWVWRPPPALGRAWAGGLAAGVLAVFLVGFWATTTEGAKLRRHERPILHVVGFRVLADPAKTRWWVDHGMPEPTPRVRRERRSLAGIAEGGLPSDPATDRFIEWSLDHGRSTLVEYLATHPKYALKSTVDARQSLLSGVTGGYLSPDARIVVPEPLTSLVYPRQSQDVYFWLVVVGLGALGVALAFGGRRVWTVPVFALAVQVPHAMVVFHGDTLEVPRHAILVAVTTRLALLILALMAIDRVVQTRSGRMFDGRGSVAP
jgi:hypothetical protein